MKLKSAISALLISLFLLPSIAKENEKVLEKIPKKIEVKVDKKEKKSDDEKISEYHKKALESYTKFDVKGYKDSIDFYDKVLSINKKDVLAIAGKSKAQSLLSRQLFSEQKWLEGSKIITSAFENAFVSEKMDSTISETKTALSMAYLIKERYSEGKNEAELVLEKDPKNYEAMLLLWLNSPNNVVLNSSDDYYKALDLDSDLPEKILDIKPDFLLTYLELGIAFAAQDQDAKSIDILEKALKINPDNEIVHTSLGYVYNDFNDIKKAQKHFELVLKDHPKNVEAIYGMAIISLKRRDRNKALDFFESACKLNYDSACDLSSNMDIRNIRRQFWRRRRRSVGMRIRSIGR